MAQHMLHSRKMVGEIVTMASTPGSDESTFTVLAKLDSIYPHAGWCYVTCHQCSKKVQAMDGLFVCKICDSPCRYPMIRYSIHVCVSDHTGNTIFTIFNQVAETLLDSSANKFFRRLGFEQFPLALQDLVGRCYAFRIRLPNYANEDSDFHNYRVVSLFEIDPIPELKSYGVVQEKVGGSKKRSHHAVVHVVSGGSRPSKPVVSVETAGSTSKIAAYAEVSTPEKKMWFQEEEGLAHEKKIMLVCV